MVSVMKSSRIIEMSARRQRFSFNRENSAKHPEDKGSVHTTGKNSLKSHAYDILLEEIHSSIISLADKSFPAQYIVERLNCTSTCMQMAQQGESSLAQLSNLYALVT